MKRWIMIIDVAKCQNCNNCFLACKDEHVGNDWSPISKPQPRHGHRWREIQVAERGRYPLIDVAFRPGNCMMCENAPCIAAGKGAVTRREDGLVLIDNELAKGRRDLVDACPYHAIWWNEELELPQKCTFCAHLLDRGWTETRCTQACPSGANRLAAMEEAEIEARLASGEFVRYQDELGTRPMVFYQNLYRVTAHFIAGSVVLDGECCEGAEVTVTGPDGSVHTGRSNGYGDFRVDGLAPGTYRVLVTAPGGAPFTCQVALEQFRTLGDIIL